MKQRGQAAIEFIMLILIVLIYLLTITKPLVDNAKDITDDIQTVIRADAESKRITNSVTEVAMLGKGTKKTILLFIPANAEIYCNTADNSIGFDMNVVARPYPSACKTGVCNKEYIFPASVDLDCVKTLMKGEENVVIINDDVTGGVATISITG